MKTRLKLSSISGALIALMAPLFLPPESFAAGGTNSVQSAVVNQRCKIAVCDWMLLKRQIDMPKVKATLDAMGWSGWLVIERSRKAGDSRNVKGNFGANTAYLKSIFQKP